MFEIVGWTVFVSALLACLILSGLVSYWISMTSDEGLRKFNRHWLGPPNWSELADIQDYCLGKAELRRIRKLAGAARVSMIVAGVSGPLAFIAGVF